MTNNNLLDLINQGKNLMGKVVTCNENKKHLVTNIEVFVTQKSVSNKEQAIQDQFSQHNFVVVIKNQNGQLIPLNQINNDKCKQGVNAILHQNQTL